MMCLDVGEPVRNKAGQQENSGSWSSVLSAEAVFPPLWIGLAVLLPVVVWLVCGVIDQHRWKNKPFMPVTTDSSLGRRLNEWVVTHPASVIIGSWCALLTVYILLCGLFAG
jgi:hypothetical protein